MPPSPWRLLVAVVAALGLALAVARYEVWWTALSQLTALGVATTYAVLGLRPRWAGLAAADYLRGLLATVALLVAVAFWAAPQTDPWQPFSVVEHALVPALVLVDVLVVHRPRCRPWWPATWVLALAAYLGWYVVGDLAVYPDLDPGRPAAFALRVAALTGLAAVAAYAVARVSGLRDTIGT